MKLEQNENKDRKSIFKTERKDYIYKYDSLMDIWFLKSHNGSWKIIRFSIH